MMYFSKHAYLEHKRSSSAIFSYMTFESLPLLTQKEGDRKL